ncbi:hypothetical protein NL676_008616 [Syzygium grande]|nr:hypothetical protein NL676_008616 [Syzygium grande]
MKRKSWLDSAASSQPAITPLGPESTIGALNRQGSLTKSQKLSRSWDTDESKLHPRVPLYLVHAPLADEDGP